MPLGAARQDLVLDHRPAPYSLSCCGTPYFHYCAWSSAPPGIDPGFVANGAVGVQDDISLPPLVWVLYNAFILTAMS